MASDSAIPDILAACEEQPDRRYGEAPLRLWSNGARLFVLSDLHMAAGLGSDGRSDCTENFFADDAFARFLAWASSRASGRAILVINGDVIDFLRITATPASDSDFLEWADVLAQVGIAKKIVDLRASVTDKERKYGLKTNDYKSVFKLHVAAKGHRPVIDALSEWLHRGNTLVIVKGNHDLEWHWRAVRDCFRLELASALVRAQRASGVAEALTNTVSANVLFADHNVVIDDVVYLEHGHRFDRYSHVVGPPVLPGASELNIPFGSFLNRYLLNLVELNLPFIDNVRPAGAILPLLLRERFFAGLKLLFYHVPFALLVIPKSYYRYLLARVLPLAVALAGPILLLLWNLRRPIQALLQGQGGSLLSGSVGANFLLPAASYFLARLVAWFQLGEPPYLDQFARDIFQEHPRTRIVSFGHTHNPDQCSIGEGRFVNTGTWIPIVETSNMELRADLTFTFLEIGPVATFLQRWNDDAGRGEALRLLRR